MAKLRNNLKLNESEYLNFLQESLGKKNLYNAAICYNDLGNIYLSKNNYKKAIWFYRKALTLNQINDIVYDNLGTAYRESNNIRKAIYYYTNSIKLNPNYSLALINLEFSLMNICDWKKKDKYNFNHNIKTPFLSILTVDSPKNNLEVAKKWI